MATFNARVLLPPDPVDTIGSIWGEAQQAEFKSYVSDGSGDGSCAITINLQTLPDQETYTVTISTQVTNVAGDPLAGDRDFIVRGLIGDVTGDGIVLPGDANAVPPHYGEPV